MEHSSSSHVDTQRDLIIKIAGDSGDGVQLIGTRLAQDSIMQGLDLLTFPNFPAEIRAPQGTLDGVSGFQMHLATHAVHTVGAKYDVLVAMNAAALRNEIASLHKKGLLIIDEQGFEAKNLRLAGYGENNPLDMDALAHTYTLVKLPMTRLTRELLQQSKLMTKERDRAKNMFVLGLLYWILDYQISEVVDFLAHKFSKRPAVLEANTAVLRAGYHYGETAELLPRHIFNKRPKADAPAKGTYRNISGANALVYGFLRAAQAVNRPLFLGSYPITPASDILHAMSKLSSFGVRTFQAEDEIAGVASAIGAAYAGSLALTSTSGPGMDLKTEAIGLAVMMEIPLIIINVQRAGPSTGMPTKIEQADLLQALYGRHGEAPLVVVAPASSGDSFLMAYEAARIAMTCMTPVIVLSDANLSNAIQSWRIPEADELTPMPEHIKLKSENTSKEKDEEDYHPYARDAYGVREWVVPGTPNKTYRMGGLEKSDIFGKVSYDGENHEKMVHLRAEKIQAATRLIPAQQLEAGAQDAKILLLGWGSTYGVLREAQTILAHENIHVAHAHIRYLNPMPANMEELLTKFVKIIIPEINNGQLIQVMRARFPTHEFIAYNEMKGAPLITDKLVDFVRGLAKG